MRMNRVHSRLWPVLGLVLWQGAVLATSLPRFGWDRLVSESDSILRARCVSSEAYRDPTTGIIWTRFHLAASETFKGAGGSEWTVTEPGGTVGGLSQIVPGTPRFDAGEEFIVFLYRTPLGKWRVRGGGQGSFQILAGKLEGRPQVRQALADVEILDSRPDSAAAQSPLPLSDLDAFVDMLRRSVRSLPASGQPQRR